MDVSGLSKVQNPSKIGFDFDTFLSFINLNNENGLD